MSIGLQAWGSEGDIAPFSALAAGLARAGYEVTLAITDNIGRDYSGLADRFGYKVIPVSDGLNTRPEEVDRVWRQVIELGNPIQQAELIMRHGFDPVAESMYGAAKDLCRSNDAVIGHFFVYPLRVAAAKAGTPMATLNIVHNCIPSAHICPPGFPDLGAWSYPWGWRIVRHMVNRIFLPRVNALRVREGLLPDNDVMAQTWAAERLNLVAVSPQICHRPVDWEARHVVCGFLNPPGGLQSDVLPEGMDAFLSAGSPPVYFTFGSMLMPNSLSYISETLAIWREAVKLAGCRAIFHMPTDKIEGFGSDDRVFMATWAPYRQAFPRCAMVIHHGGAGTTQSCLFAGKPSIIVAHVADQFFWGQELERLGVAGKTLKRKGLKASQVASGIRAALPNASMPAIATEIGERMAAEDGVGTAISYFEKLILGNDARC
jgi:UDP:flavonoid glycosyltransferase YjiC (YdhE family)